MRLSIRMLVAFVTTLILGTSTLGAQTMTTSALVGAVTDEQGGVLPGADVVAVHEPTGTRYETVTASDGRYQLLNVRTGGPYNITATLSGFREKTLVVANVALGEAATTDFKLPLQNVQETVTVTAETPLIDSTRAGTAANISKDTIENLPTISRSISDFARTSPFVNLNPASAGSDSGISVAGRNIRYNSMSIDGAVNNDVFGIPDSGVPGGQTGSQPISLDAIQEIQVVVSPYDVRQGGFSGGGINAITRSGSNTFSGTAYWFQRSEALVGQIPGIATPSTPSPADTKVGVFSDKQNGFSVGGPIVKNKAFFFTNLDWARKQVPTGFSADNSGGQNWAGGAHLADIQQIAAIAKSKYGYDIGALGQLSPPLNSNKFFGRGDFNLSNSNRLAFRVNYIDGLKNLTSSGQPGTLNYAMPTAFYDAAETVTSPVGQLNSTFGSSGYNEFRVTYTRDRFHRALPSPTFPYVRIDFPDQLTLRFGSEQNSHANELDQDATEITDDVTLVHGTHSFTFGTHNEFFQFRNVFIANLYGAYEFTGVQAFADGFATGYNLTYSNSSDPRQAARFSVRQYGGYAGDQWRVKSNLSLTYGIRIDKPNFPDKPSANPIAVADFGYATDVVPAPTMWSPRVGFNWDVSGGSENRAQIRGGIGFFTGRTPYVWLSNQYSNTGVDFTSLSVTNAPANPVVPFSADPLNQPKTIPGAQTGRQTINLIDPDYKYPEVVRGNLAYDRALGFWGLVGVGEFLFTDNVKDIKYENLNLVPTGATRPDGRLVFVKKDNNLNEAIFLTNTGEGSSWSTSVKVERPFRNNFSASGSYLYNRATSITDGVSSVARSNYVNNPAGVDPNNPDNTMSVYSVGSRVNFTSSIGIPLGKGLTSMASFFYNGQQGRPYVIMFTNDANADTATNNDIAFIPATADQVVVTNGTWAQLDAYLSSDPASKDNRGQIPPRNSGRAPWMNQLDFRYALTVPTRGRTKVELTMDVFNLLNLFNKNWGWQYFPKFPASGGGLITYAGIDSTTGQDKEILNISTITSPTFQGTFDRDELRSRWQAQWGARFRF